MCVEDPAAVAVREDGDDRPRERLARLGPAALADRELLALIVRSGGACADAAVLAGLALERVGGRDGLPEATLASLAGLPELGPAKAAALVAAVELGRRVAERQLAKPHAARAAAKLFEASYISCNKDNGLEAYGESKVLGMKLERCRAVLL